VKQETIRFKLEPSDRTLSQFSPIAGSRFCLVTASCRFVTARRRRFMSNCLDQHARTSNVTAGLLNSPFVGPNQFSRGVQDPFAVIACNSAVVSMSCVELPPDIEGFGCSCRYRHPATAVSLPRSKGHLALVTSRHRTINSETPCRRVANQSPHRATSVSIRRPSTQLLPCFIHRPTIQRCDLRTLSLLPCNRVFLSCSQA
jgi:hypothetical protein